MNQHVFLEVELLVKPFRTVWALVPTLNLPQVGLYVLSHTPSICKALATYTTTISFDSAVSHQMVLKLGAIYEALATDVAGELLLLTLFPMLGFCPPSSVLASVGPQVVFLAEGLAAKLADETVGVHSVDSVDVPV